MLVSIRFAVISGIFALVGCSSSGVALAIDLEKGDSRDPVSRQFQDGAVASTLLAAQFYGMSGFATLDEGGSYYALLGTALIQYEMNTRKVVGSWPLTRWSHDVEQTELFDYLSEFVGNENASSVLYPEYEYFSESFYGNRLGCYPKSPLRYGDINGDGANEVVLFISDDFVVFSPIQEKIIFSQRLNVRDWLTLAETETYYYYYSNTAEESPQYQSEFLRGLSGNMQGTPGAGTRGYAKLYMGSFSGETNRDILVWRKLYRSRLKNDAIPGFIRISDRVLHYRFIDGEYLPQDTPEATIRSWLSSNNLTWQKGYPSKSECPGEEGQLIPEMHDPLLNDPDVLQ